MNTPIKNSLARLPYQEMMQLSREISERTGVQDTVVAEVLSSLEYDTDIEERDLMFLAMSFNRKKQITIQPHGDNGYRVCIPSIEGAEVIGTDIRACVSQLFDHVVTYNALMRSTSTLRKGRRKMKVRYVIMVPVEIVDEIVGDDDFMTDWGRQHADRYRPVESQHPREPGPYQPKLMEAVKLDEDAEVDMDDLVAPGQAA